MFLDFQYNTLPIDLLESAQLRELLSFNDFCILRGKKIYIHSAIFMMQALQIRARDWEN